MKTLYALWLYFITALAAIMTSKTAGAIFSPWKQPTELFPLSLLNAVGYLSVFLICLLAIFQRRNILTLPKGKNILIKIILALATVEAFSFLPCLFMPMAELCGLYVVLIHQLVAPVAVIALVLIAPAIQPRKTRNLLLGSLFALCMIFTVKHFMQAPASIEDCLKMGDNLSQSNCISQFAIAQNNAEACLKVPYDALRFSCIYKIAGHLSDPKLCDMIKSLPSDEAIASNSSSRALQYKQTCLKVSKRKHRPGKLVDEKE